MKHVLILMLVLAPFAARAEMSKQVLICAKSGAICPYVWPALPAVPGWKQDMDSSFALEINAQAPSGTTFSEAVTVIYAKAVYKRAHPESKDLDGFIQNDQATFRHDDRGLKIGTLPPMRTQAGQPLKRFSFTPGGKGNWEQVAYGEEKDEDGNEYFLVFVISSRSKDGLDSNLKAFEQFVSSYR